jgi:hypothetical protein
MEEMMAEAMPTCPMAKACAAMMERPFFGAFLLVPGLLFMAAGVLIIFLPQVLVWLMASGSILLGVALLLLANFMRGAGARLKRANS